MICLATPRLLLRTWQAEDGDDLGDLFGGHRPAIGNIDEREVAGMTPAEIIDRLQAGWAENGYGIFAVEGLDKGRVIGLAGLVPDDSAPPSVVWRVEVDESSPGLAAEALAALIDWTFGLFDIETITASAESDAAAATVFAAVGLELTRRTIDPEREVWIAHFATTMSRWREDEG